MKTRNFFLAMFSFLWLAIIITIIAEIRVIQKKEPVHVLTAPTLTYTPILISNQHPNPHWLIPLHEIESNCDNPWIIRRVLPTLNYSIDDLIEAGLSDCYQISSGFAIRSHLWHQGIGKNENNITSPSHLLLTGDNVELFLKYDAKFNDLGVPPPETVSMWGFIVHDLNGDGVYNPEEPVLPDSKMCLIREKLESLCVVSDSNGKYKFDRIIPGGWHFKVFSPIKDKLSEFRFTNQLIENDILVPSQTMNGYLIPERHLNLTEFNSIDLGFLHLVEQDHTYNIFLMQEWATYFSSSKDAHLFEITAYFDFDTRKGYTRIYNGASGPTYDQHDGLDTSCPKGTEILSVAEGRVIAIFNESTVAIRHNNQLVSIYGHGTPLVVEDQFVPRGYPVSLCNELFTANGPHLHLAIWKNSPWLPVVIYGIPPFADMINLEAKWVPNKYPLEKKQIVYVLQGARGIWTEINNPHYPYVGFIDN